MRLLLVEDDEILTNGLTEALRQVGYEVEHMASGLDADQALTYQDYDVVILDLNLPGLDGLEILQRLRNRQSHTPVLILSARDSLEDRINGLDIGADDYLAKPFKLPELEARLRALIRRGHFGNQLEMSIGALRFNTSERRLYANGQPVALSARETHVLELLMRHSGKVVSKQRFIEHLCGWHEDITINAIEVYISRLRRKLEIYNTRFRSIRGIGYLIETCPEPE